jgi:hypothetical protein
MRLEHNVRIDGTFRTDRTGLPETAQNAGKTDPSAQAGAATPPPQLPKVEAHLQPYVDKARETGEMNLQAVQEAKASGQLDTPDAIRRAAQALADLDF